MINPIRAADKQIPEAYRALLEVLGNHLHARHAMKATQRLTLSWHSSLGRASDPAPEWLSLAPHPRFNTAAIGIYAAISRARIKPHCVLETMKLLRRVAYHAPDVNLDDLDKVIGDLQREARHG